MQAPWWLAITIGILSGSLGAFVTFSFNYRKERAQFLRERSEQIYFSVDRFQRSISADYILWRSSGKYTRKNISEKELELLASDYNMISSGCGIYFPHLSIYVELLIESKDSLMDSIKGSTNDCDSRAKLFEDAAGNLKTKLSQQCRRPLNHITYMSIFDGV